MSHDPKSGTTDLMRWSFSIETGRAAKIWDHLDDLGADVLVRNGRDFLVLWDEPEGEFGDVIEALWAINGEPFEVIEEVFHRLELHTFHHIDDESASQAA